MNLIEAISGISVDTARIDARQAVKETRRKAATARSLKGSLAVALAAMNTALAVTALAMAWVL